MKRFSSFLNEIIAQLKSATVVHQTAPQIALNPDDLPVLNTYPKLAALLSTGRKTASVNEVSEALLVTPKLVANRVKDRTLKCSPRGDKLILLSSVVDWTKTLQSSGQNGSKTRDLLLFDLIQFVSLTNIGSWIGS